MISGTPGTNWEVIIGNWDQEGTRVMNLKKPAKKCVNDV